MEFMNSLKMRIGFITPDPKLALLPELVRYFLTRAIEERANVLFKPGNESLESYRQIVSTEYSQRMENTLNEEIQSLKKLNAELTFPAFIEGNLDRVFFRSQLVAADFDSPENFEKLLGGVRSHFHLQGLFQALPLPPKEARAIASLILRCVQKVVLQIISNDYAATAKKITVPETTQVVIKDLLSNLDLIASRLLPYPALKSLPRAEAELNVAIARSELRVALPVRSIPTAPLTETDLEKHYVGRSDKDAQGLARQVRHADGTILVTGYRGVGKSSFVNRVIYHVTQSQRSIPGDGWLVVPVTINLAKVSGVQNILRLTLRSVRSALVNPDTASPQPIPGFSDNTPLPLSTEREIEPLQEAYARATYKVTMTRANASESKYSADGSLALDVSKLLAPLGGFQLPSFGFKASKSRTQTLNRSLSLLDYDENAAEDDLMRLILSLANPRLLYGESGPMVRIKLVLIFDELDKMDTDKALTPMIEGLKNLFLQRFAVFILVTSKMFYYHLLAERAKEDAMLSSYFSAIVPVPLLTFEQARRMVGDWIDWPDSVQPLDIENNLLDQLTRWLLYRSHGNPRDIIRELRQMQEWADTTERPYLSDRLTKLQSLQIFAGIQKCIEKVARPDSQNSTTDSTEDADGLTLVSERLGGDESRLEQIRRGLYILTETLINQETLSLKPADLEQLRKDNFSLLRDSDVEQLAIQLGNTLSLLHRTLPMDVFSSLNLVEAPELFVKVDSETLRTTPEFYRLTGRQAAGTDVEVKTTAAANKETKDLVSDAETLAQRPGWAERLSAIGIIKQIGPSNLSIDLQKFLNRLSTDQQEPVAHRREAARQLTHDILFRENPDLTALITQEADDEMLSLFLPLLGKAGDQASRARATDAVVALFKMTGTVKTFGASTRLSGKNADTALTVLQAVAERDVLDDVLEWLCSTTQTPEVQESALLTLNLLSEKLKVNQAEKILSNDRFLKYFVTASRPVQTVAQRELQNILLNMGALQNMQLAAKYESHLRSLFAANPLEYIEKLLLSNINEDLTHVLAPLWQAAFDRTSPELAEFVVRVMASEHSEQVTERLVTSLRQTPEFEVRMLPYLQQTYDQPTQTPYSAIEKKRVDEYFTRLKAPMVKKSPIAAPPDMLQQFGFSPGSSAANLRIPPSTFSDVTGSQIVLPLLATIVTLLVELFVLKIDLPAGASLSKAISSRLILFAADFLIVFFAIRQVDAASSNSQPKFDSSAYSSFSYAKSSSINSIIPVFAFWVIFGLFYSHNNYVGALTFGKQLLLFLINLPASLLLTRLYREAVDN